MPVRSLFIASEVRSGSTYTAEIIAYALADLRQFSFWDLTKEHLRDLSHTSSADDVRHAIEALWVNEAGFRSAKVLCGQLSILVREARRDRALAETLFGHDCYWLIVRRRDRLAQAVSLAMARSDGVYHAYAADESTPVGDVSMDDVDGAFKAIALTDQFLDLFAPIPANVMSVYYEDIFDDHRALISAISSFTGIEVGCLDAAYRPPALVRIGQGAKADLVERFRTWFVEHYHERPNP